MSRLIDADAVKLNYGGLVHISPYDFQGIAKYFAEQIAAAPTIDAVPVVRCRECKHYREALSQTSDNAVVVWCAADKYPHNDVMPDDWYCAAGEREEDDHE